MDRRVPSERELFRRCEDADPVVGGGIGRRHDERRLGEVRPPGERSHLIVCQALGGEDDGHGVAEPHAVGEDVDLGKRPHHVASRETF